MTTLRNATKFVSDFLRRQRNPIQDQGNDRNPDNLALFTSPMSLEGRTNWISSVAFLPDSDHLMSGSLDGTVRKWRISDGCEVGKVMEHGSAAYAIAVSPDGKVVASGGYDERVVFWSTDTCEKIAESQDTHADWIWSLSFAPDSQIVASGSFDGSIILWNALTGECTAGPFQVHIGYVAMSVAFSPSGDRLVTCRDDGDILIWDTPAGKAFGPPIRLSVSGVFSVVWSLDDRQLICGSHDGTIKCIDSFDGTLLATCQGHTDLIRSMALSCNGMILASASWDHTVRLWSTLTHQQLASLKPPEYVNSVSISPDGRYLASGCDDGKLRIWQVQQRKEDPAASDTDLPSSRLQRPKSPSVGEGDRANKTIAGDSYLDLPAVLSSRAAVDDGVYTRFFDLDDPTAPQPDMKSDARGRKWKKKANESRQYLAQQIKHFRDGMLPRHGLSHTSGTSQRSSSQKLKARVSHVRRQTSLGPENARDGSTSQQVQTDGKSLKATLMSAARLEHRLVVASSDPPVQQEKIYLVKKDGKWVRRPDPPTQATAQTRGPQPTPGPNNIPGSATATPGQAQGSQVSNDDHDDEVCGCCGYFLIRR